MLFRNRVEFLEYKEAHTFRNLEIRESWGETHYSIKSPYYKIDLTALVEVSGQIYSTRLTHSSEHYRQPIVYSLLAFLCCEDFVKQLTGEEFKKIVKLIEDVNSRLLTNRLRLYYSQRKPSMNREAFHDLVSWNSTFVYYPYCRLWSKSTPLFAYDSTNTELALMMIHRNVLWFICNETKKVYFEMDKMVVIDGDAYHKDKIDLTVSINCPKCGRVSRNKKSVITKGPRQGCITCLDGGVILDYSIKAPTFFPQWAADIQTKNALITGIELELEVQSSEIDKTKTAIGVMQILGDHAIIKSDSSVPNGFEIVTKPATIEMHKKAFTEFFESEEAHNLKSTLACGMHVHVNKAGLSEMQIGKILAFLNHKENEAFLQKVGGRSLNSYCRRLDDVGVASGVYYDPDAKKVVRDPQMRHSVLNLNNQETIEFRSFAATTDQKVFNKNLEFIQAMIDYTRLGAVPFTLKELLLNSNFQEYLKPRRKFYPNLCNHLFGERKVNINLKGNV